MQLEPLLAISVMPEKPLDVQGINRDSTKELFERVYDELRRIAAAKLVPEPA